MKNLIIAFCLIFVFGCNSSTNDQSESKSNQVPEMQVTLEKVNTEELKVLMEDESIQIVDVRTPEETNEGYIEGAVIGMNFLSGEFEQNLQKLDSARPVVVYCARGGRSAKAAEILKEKGFKIVYDYTDGYTGWAAQ